MSGTIKIYIKEKDRPTFVSIVITKYIFMLYPFNIYCSSNFYLIKTKYFVLLNHIYFCHFTHARLQTHIIEKQKHCVIHEIKKH